MRRRYYRHTYSRASNKKKDSVIVGLIVLAFLVLYGIDYATGVSYYVKAKVIGLYEDVDCTTTCDDNGNCTTSSF